ncbi:relaxin receptor 2-like [Cylas formicarius]|uniref:relaxin receptor 2-like n=1 Tax=Cylas formicarius TaxID=197179 RepID=UPI0029588560|nr:relaxin receptor 2-like [Cylas formicarius]
MPCNNEEKCIQQKDVCNSYQDCTDGEDEDPVLCADLHGSTYLVDSEINSIIEQSLTIHQKFNICDVDFYPTQCICRFVDRVYCNDAELTEIPPNISENVKYLGLANNNIEFLSTIAMDRYNLKLLFLEANKISFLQSNIFRLQENMEKLFLTNNFLTVLEKGVFTGLANLRWLFLDDNQLTQIDMSNFEATSSLQWINLGRNNLTFTRNETFPYLPNLLELFLNENRIRKINSNTFANLTKLHLLNLRSNQIKTIDEDSFHNLVELKELDLFGNQIKVLPVYIFAGQHKLAKLYLGMNPFTYIQKELFFSLKDLKSLNLEEIEIGQIDVNMFDITSLESIYFKTYKYCAYAPKVRRCRPISDGISSTNQLLFKPIFRYSNWVMCVVTVAGNTLVIFSRYLFRDENKTLSIVIKNLAVSDGLMGIYLLIIAIQDIKFRDNYNSEAMLWISSWNCALTGIVGMISLEVSVLFLVFMSIERFIIITMPFRRYASLSVKETWRVMLSIWCFGIAIAVIPALSFMSSTKFYGLNGLCFPLHIDDPYIIGWQYSALIFFGINGPSLFIIVCVYAGMFVSIQHTRNATSLPMKDYEFAIRFFFIVLANIACWLPILVAKAIVYWGVEISADVYGWLIVFVLPINSALNPILYTFTTRRYRNRLGNVSNCIKQMTTTGAADSKISQEMFNFTHKYVHRNREPKK